MIRYLSRHQGQQVACAKTMHLCLNSSPTPPDLRKPIRASLSHPMATVPSMIQRTGAAGSGVDL